jgi:hypothetical protein
MNKQRFGLSRAAKILVLLDTDPELHLKGVFGSGSKRVNGSGFMQIQIRIRNNALINSIFDPCVSLAMMGMRIQIHIQLQ